ncbi:MAG: FAD-dependent oxidoreductase, partial [Bacteroidales bacterium]
MKTTDVLIIGGSAAGMVAALTGKNSWPEKEFILIKKQKEVMVPCGIPYIFGTLENSSQNIMPVDNMLEKAGIASLVDEVVMINTDTKVTELASGKSIKYDKLVIATGSRPSMPKWLAGGNKKNVFTIPKDKVYIDQMVEQLKGLKKIVVIGAGFIGVEFSDELNKKEYEVVLVEKLPDILGLAFDPELSKRIEEIITKRGVKIITGNGIKEITGGGSVTGITLEDGTHLDAN